MTIPQSVLDAAEISAIGQLVLTERESRDLGNWERMRDCFHPDSLVRLSWFNGTGDDFVTGSIDMARREVRASHRVGPPIVRLSGARAVASLAAIIDIPVTLGGIDGMLSSHARFLYRVERRDHRWRINFFDAVYLRDEFTTPLPAQKLPVEPTDVAPFRASYRMLSYLLTSQGYAVNDALPGIDRPAAVAALEAEIAEWSAGTT